MISAKSEENGLSLKLNFTSTRVSQNFVGGLLVPDLDMFKISKLAHFGCEGRGVSIESSYNK